MCRNMVCNVCAKQVKCVEGGCMCIQVYLCARGERMCENKVCNTCVKQVKCVERR